MIRIMALFFSILWLTACSSTSIEEYASNQPELNVESFFQGDLVAHGVLKDRGGKVTRYFYADLKGSWENGVGTLEEWFVFDDGEQQERIWTLTPNGDGTYTATAGDVIGAGRLETSGNALFMKYVLRVPYDGDTIDLNVDDRMYLVTPDHLINESVLTKFGFEVASLTLSIRQKAHQSE
ncbi:MAG: hypothetical protein CMG93_14845 [Marinomonas sp.]|uniref:DUF3833 domain-containing protein n=1 Tax=Marinomonas communis TaxID=28254 RepID=UPI000C5F5F7F|nr:DUF3833 domain-containing protein [Marinomonas communis]MAF17231.1 hypothetical protein [Marinomonas sp.]MCC4274205.1 DUF3833 domain-containing protein [Marinomonas communis]MEC8081206.1 DUF3833 domain-containing protein [Pseudomonadota bacterium]RUM51289.1 MAG: DUF3833 domain-containing protein [Marinomonas sp.]